MSEHLATVGSALRAAVEPPVPTDTGELLRETILGGEIRRRAGELSDEGVELLLGPPARSYEGR